VLIANPTCFLVQKVFDLWQAKRLERAKDILYIHDTFEAFGSRLAALGTEWTGKIKSRLHARSMRVIERRTLFLVR
jgi:hypothetical protein